MRAMMAKMSKARLHTSWLLVPVLASMGCGSLWTPFLGTNPACEQNPFGCTDSANPQNGSPVVLFRDDFDDNSLDPVKWTFLGTTVTEAGGIMQVLQNVTDQGGVLISVTFPINTKGKITLSRRVNVHYAGCCSSPKLIFSVDSVPEFGIAYSNDGFSDATYIANYGIRVTRNGARPGIRAEQTDVSASIPAVWDEWFDEKIEYNPATGTLDYFVTTATTQNSLTYNVGAPTAASSPLMKVAVDSWGWFTGQQHLMDNLEISQEK